MSGLNKYQSYLLEAAFKGAVKNKPNTSTLLAWYEENNDIKKRIDFSSIWLDADKIPLEAPKLITGENYSVKYGNIDVDVLRYYKDIPLYKVQGTSASFYNELLTDSIESSFGTGYAVELTDTFGSKVPFGLNKWIADPTTGIVTFIENTPNGYSSPFYISFYRYIGRKGNNGILTTDGHQTMLPGYVPTDNKSLVTKEYVDNNVTDVSSIVKKLIPNTPPTFEKKDLEIVNKHRKGQLVTTTDEPVDVVYIEDSEIKVRVPQFWDEDKKGFFDIYINNNLLYEAKMEDLENDNYNKNYLDVESIVESYPGDIVADDFYKSINLIIKLTYLSHISPYIPSPSYPIFSVKVRWYSTINKEGYYSNSTYIGLDNYYKEGLISKVNFNNVRFQNKYISGVPAMIENDAFIFSSNVSTINRFKKNMHGHLSITNIFDKDIIPKKTYPSFGLPIEINEPVVIPKNVYLERMHIAIESRNLDDELNSFSEYDWTLRVDSVSNESNRVTSPDSNGLNFGKEWSTVYQKQSLKESNELQMLNGKYQWPRGDYSKNGADLPFTSVWSQGPNYNLISKEGTRFVTFKYNVSNINGFYFTLDNAEGFEFNPMDFTFTNIASLQCIVDNKYDWLNMNVPFDGVLSPFDFDNKGCLVVNKSSPTRRYCTFGTEVISGNIYIVLGIPYNMNIKLSGITVSVSS